MLLVEEFKYLGIILMSDGKREHQIEKLIRLVAAVLQLPHWSVEVKQEPGFRMKLSVYQSIYIP